MANNYFTFLIFALQFVSQFMKLVILTSILVLMAVLMLGVKVLFVKNGKFPSGHVHDIEPLRKQGIGCASHNCDNKNK